MNCWITTHWPVSPTPPDLSRHVYVKARRKKLPQIGDTVLVYEAESAHVNGKRCKRAVRIHGDDRTEIVLPKGRGTIVLAVTVQGSKRPVSKEDVVYDFGNLREWSVIPCGNPRSVHEMSRAHLMEELGKGHTTHPRWLNLYKVPDKYVQGILQKLGVA